MNALTVSILDDNTFFLRLFHERISRHSMHMEIGNNCQINVQSYSSHERFLHHYTTATDLVFLDFELGNGVDATRIITELKKTGKMPHIAIITEHGSLEKMPADMRQYVGCCIKKDNDVIPKSCLLIQDMMMEKFQA